MPEEIRMYGTGWCPDCARARQVFTKGNVPFTWLDIEKNKDACAYVEQANHGNRSVPTIVFPDGSVMVEPSSKELADKLAKLK